MKDYTRGDTIWLKAVFRDENDLLFDPSSTWGRIYDSSSTVVRSISELTKVSTGHYSFAWQTNPSSHASGMVAFEACGTAGANVYVRRDILFKLV
jgi:hypothetical protein